MTARTFPPPMDRELTEPERVLAWRISRLVKAGYDEESAAKLGRSGVDLYAAIELLERGCPVGVAVRILE